MEEISDIDFESWGRIIGFLVRIKRLYGTNVLSGWIEFRNVFIAFNS